MLKYLVAAAIAVSANSAMAAGHVAEGEKITAKKCKACHMISDGDNVILKGGRTGPNLFGVIGRQAGTEEGFKYGDDLVAAGEAGLVWDEQTLSDYIADPRAFLREYLDDGKAKSRMSFKLRKDDERAAVAAYLASINE